MVSDNPKAHCTKMSYTTKQEADKDIKALEATKKHFSKKYNKIKPNKKFSSYLCPRCGEWHLTTQRISKKKHRR